MPNPEENEEPEGKNGRVRLDDATVAAKTQHYPDEVKDRVMWLANFMRVHCASRLDLIAMAARRLGHRTTENYFYRILTGRYFVDKDTGKVFGSISNFEQIVDNLREGVSTAERAGKTPFIETGTYRRIRDLFDDKRADDAVCKFGVIVGPTGGQKTASAKHYCHLNNSGKCIHIEAPETASLGTFVTDLAVRYGHSKWATSPVHKKNISESIGLNSKKLICIDNVQRLFVKRLGHNQPVFNYLQKLQDDTGCAIVLMFAEDRAEFLTEGIAAGYFEQFEGRAGGRDQFLILDKFTPREDLVAIAKAYNLPTDKGTINYLEKLSQMPGRIRILFDALTKAQRVAKAREIPLTVDLIREVRGEVIS
jgi:DNA transposition AAA+ family ATPase